MGLSTYHISARAAADGSITITLPTRAAAGQVVDIELKVGMRPELDYRKWAQEMVGCISDPAFQRPEQPALRPIEPL